MDIIDRLHYQLLIIKAILIKEIKSGSYTLYYNICETEYKFLDKYELRRYLTITDVKNTIFLKMINETCLFIINSLQNELQSIPYKKLKENLVVEGEFKDIFTEIDFHAFCITEKRITQFNSISGKIDFVKNYDYTSFDIYEIVIRCNLILNWITASYPETIPDEMIIKKVDKVKEVKKKLNNFFTNIDEGKKELHNNIFKGNSIYLFEKYFDNKSMNFQSRTDFRFLFEQMKNDNLIYNTVSLGQYIRFISKYGYNETELKSIEMNAVKNIQRTKDYNLYKDNLKTTLK